MATITLSIFLAALFRIRKDDSILAVTNPPSMPVLAAILSKILSVPYTLMVHDVYPDIMASCGVSARKAPVFLLLHRISRKVLGGAKTVICIGRDMREHLSPSRRTRVNNGIQVVPLWADCEEIHPTPRGHSCLLSELGLSDKFVVLYAGNMGLPHGIDTLGSTIKELEKDPAIHFLVIGSGPKKRIFEQMVASGSKNITLLPPRPRAAQNEFLNACDVAILSLVPGMLGLAVPSRTYNLMAAGKPIIALVSASSEVARVVAEEQIGWVVEPGDVLGAARAVRAAKENLEQLRVMGTRARKAAESKYAPAIILPRLSAACGRCTHN